MAWHSNRKVTSLFVHGPQNRNVWVQFDGGLGWKHIWPDYDSQSITIAIMAAHARAENRDVNVEEENGRVKTLYVW